MCGKISRKQKPINLNRCEQIILQLKDQVNSISNSQEVDLPEKYWDSIRKAIKENPDALWRVTGSGIEMFHIDNIHKALSEVYKLKDE